MESNLARLLEVTSGIEVAFKIGKGLEQRLTGRFYTHERIGRAMAKDIAKRVKPIDGQIIKIIDPFCGDGRLVRWLIEELYAAGKLPNAGLSVVMWDCDKEAIKVAQDSVQLLFSKIPTSNNKIEIRETDSFSETLFMERTFDICVTNPPWETIKPDSRELAELDDATKDSYIKLLKEKVFRLEKAYPHSKGTKKFSGWGANLARCGIEASIRLVKNDGHFGIVAPASIFGDQISAPLRAWLLTTNRIATIHHFSAEARLFDGVDQSAVYFVGDKGSASNQNELNDSKIDIVKHPDKSSEDTPPSIALDLRYLESHDYSIGFGGSMGMALAMPYLINLPKLGDFETASNGLIKLGRELDETRIAKKLCQAGSYRFIKGRQVNRYSFNDSTSEFLSPEITPPVSANFLRIVWRDVARQSSVRRMIVTLLPAGYVTGNSLNVLTVKVGQEHLLKALLAVLNSTIFEAQVRASISTNHLSVGAIRKIRVPDLMNAIFFTEIGRLVEDHINTPTDQTAAFIDTAIARWYGLPDEIYTGLLDQLEMNAPDDVAAIRQILAARIATEKDHDLKKITNHYASTLSELDLKICHAVPPGGNWKDIPESVPSQRLENIRTSFAAGQGSRSTYYGRLHPDRPSYTINTYFTRPGNGCHIHYDYTGGQHRTISQREAARLQSFPDGFEFKGSKTSVGTQIGNAVPPLLAYQVARHLNIVGQTVDLFAGAGGLGLGFGWAGWQTLVGNELESSFADTYRENVHHDIVVGDIRESKITEELLSKVKANRDPALPLCVIGGPPCQGFSTAGNKRSMEDDRNWLFKDYCGLLSELKPDVFVFENVTGLINMEGGRVFSMVKDELSKHAKRLIVWKLHSENYGIPQRRSRIIIIGDNTGRVPEVPPTMVTAMTAKDLVSDLPPPPSVKDALDDLPSLNPGQDGGAQGYRHKATTAYQEFMRGSISADQYLNRITQ
jgi:DNA-cytosine methyltransferase